MKKLYILIAFSTFILQLNWSQQKMELDSTINHLFNQSEIKDLETILNFFNNQIARFIGQSSENEELCYLKFLEIMTTPPDTACFDVPISFEEQLEMYSQISDTTFNQIWVFHESMKKNSTVTNKRLELTFHGKYQLFLKQLGNEYKFLKNYHESLRAMRCLSASMWWNPIVHHKEYNLNDIKVRLFIAIHYLTINDQNKRREKF
ncbi:hypothetical protein KEM09_11270 [Carboxylicivirga mesophila]|uniref:Uncharacterized protein n=1 Tax=Carboxylicivirga mesophila TaxID=1166478 RepID=A0ABS5KAD0_9BACT|nr:hypothetical protein [Carboxylicivirga mesophila]MBS2211989.1 hypothetical protein [Carboxylicivirga mesophila]